MTAGLISVVGRTSLSAGVMILAAVILRLRFQERTPRRVFCLLWDLILIRLLVLAEIPSPVSARRFLPALAAQSETAYHQPLVSAATPGAKVWGELTIVQTAESVAEAVSPAPSWDAILTILWLAGGLAIAVWFLSGHFRCRRDYAASLPVRDEFVLDWLAAHPLRRPVQARYSDRIASPLTYGVLYPVILLPAGLDWRDKTTLSWILAHEHTHIKRFDALRKGVLTAALCLHWFNPLVWTAYVLANRDMELACDEAVLRGRGDREGYALALLGMEERRGRGTFAGFSQNPLEERIKAIMKHKHTSLAALLAVLIVMSLATTVFAASAPKEKAAPEQAAPVASYVEPVEDSIIMSKNSDGEEFYSDDNGETWMNEEGYHAKYGDWGENWRVEWWSYNEYKEWLEQEKADLQSIIGEKGWTPSTGWFTWDQEKVDETIALYERQLEDIKKGALLSKTIVDRNGNKVEDAMLSSGIMATTTEFTLGDEIVEKDIHFDSSALLEGLKAYGVTGNEDIMYYNGQRIRNFVDGAPAGDTGYSVQYVHTDKLGEVDVHTLRSVIFNPDGSYDNMGDLIGVAATGDRDFNQELIDVTTYHASPAITHIESEVSIQAHPKRDASYAGQAAAVAEGSGERGRTFEEIFAQYESFGLTYAPREGGMGALTYDGQPVRSFADLKPDGGTFSYEDPYAESGLRLRTVYDQNGNLTGLSEA